MKMSAITLNFVNKVYIFAIKFNFATKTSKVIAISYDIYFLTKVSNILGA